MSEFFKIDPRLEALAERALSDCEKPFAIRPKRPRSCNVVSKPGDVIFSPILYSFILST